MKTKLKTSEFGEVTIAAGGKDGVDGAIVTLFFIPHSFIVININGQLNVNGEFMCVYDVCAYVCVCVCPMQMDLPDCAVSSTTHTHTQTHIAHKHTSNCVMAPYTLTT